MSLGKDFLENFSQLKFQNSWINVLELHGISADFEALQLCNVRSGCFLFFLSLSHLFGIIGILVVVELNNVAVIGRLRCWLLRVRRAQKRGERTKKANISPKTSSHCFRAKVEKDEKQHQQNNEGQRADRRGVRSYLCYRGSGSGSWNDGDVAGDLDGKLAQR